MEINKLINEFCEYSTFIKGFSPCTIKRYRYCVDYYARSCGITQIEEVTELNIKQFFLNGRMVRKWSANSFITILKSLVVFFRWCEKEKHMIGNPAVDMEIPKLEKRLPPKLTRQEASKLIEIAYNYPYQIKFAKHRNRAIMSVFLMAGLRKRELLNLKYTDVDIENRSVFVRLGKGNKDRVVPICDRLADTLGKYLLERQKAGKTCPELFTALNTNTGFTSDGLRRMMTTLTKVLGKNFGVHKLRHTFATQMIEGGCDIFSLSKMMGHSDIKTTTIYLAATSEHLRSQISKHPLNKM